MEQSEVVRTFSVTFHLTHNCNLRCGYCYTGEKFGAGMELPVADAAVAFALSEGARKRAELLEIGFFGGEPLLKRDLIFDVVDKINKGAGKLETSFRLSTNGVLLTRELIRKLVAARVYIAISIDGPPEIQDIQRPDAGGHGSSERLDNVIDELLAHNPMSNVTCVVTPESADRVDMSVRWLYARGFRYISTSLDYGAPWDRASITRLEESFERLARWYVDRTIAGEKFYLGSFDDRIRTRTRGPLASSERCRMGVAQVSVAPSGNLYPCVQFVKEDEDLRYSIGDVWKGLDQGRAAALSCSSEAPKEECSGCALQTRCSSWCACSNMASTGSLTQASPVLCNLEQFLIPIADRAAAELYRRKSSMFLHKHYNPAFPMLSFVEDVVIRSAREEAP